MKALILTLMMLDINLSGFAHKTALIAPAIPDFVVVVDNFERYGDEEGSRIWETWIDGWTNGTGATVGNEYPPWVYIPPPTRSGEYSMPFEYDNADPPYYSEAYRTWDVPQDWTVGGLGQLSLWVRGEPVSLWEKPDGTLVMSGYGSRENRKWTADDYGFVHKRLSGDGEIVARIDSLRNAEGWVRAGVMIRANLDHDSPYAATAVTAAHGVSFAYCPGGSNGGAQTNNTGPEIPHWVKLTRRGNTFTAQHSNDGMAWQDITDAQGKPVVVGLAMPQTVYIGLCVSGSGQGNWGRGAATAVFSDHTITGDVEGTWQVVKQSWWYKSNPTNTPDDLYVALQDDAGKTGVAVHPHPAALNVTEWRQWKIPLSTFSGAGVDLTAVKRIYVGVGDRANPQPKGAGWIHIDDIRVIQSAAVDANLVGWWTFDEGSGTVAHDYSGNICDGTIAGVTWAQGLHGGALDFAGGYVDIPAAAWATIDIQATVAFWAYVRPGASFILGAFQDPANGQARVMSVSLGNGYVYFDTGGTTADGYDRIRKVADLTDYQNTWTHWAFVKNAETGDQQIYLNGVLWHSGTGLTRTMTGVTKFTIGCHPYSGGSYVGLLDDLRLYDRALEAREINILAARQKAYDPRPADGAMDVVVPLLEWTPAASAVFRDVYLGTNPDLTEADLVSPGQFPTIYYHVPGLEPGVRYYWRVDEIEADGAVHTGDVWSFVARDVKAYHPGPADGANDASTTPTLTWLPGIGAVQHHVYFGDSAEAVGQGAAETDKGILTEPTFTPGELEPLATYYWRVDEIGVDGSVRMGEVWRFATCLVVDDFESYNDDDNRIYETWIDGWTNGTGSLVLWFWGAFMEPPVHGGKQSMPLGYDNTHPPYHSEVYRNWNVAQDWTIHDTLTLYVHGRTDNDGDSLYVALEDTANRASAVVVHPDPNVTLTSKWSEWKIPLSDFTSVNRTAITRIYLGVGNRDNPQSAGAGQICIDDIGLRKRMP